jgi:hypothetical protein
MTAGPNTSVEKRAYEIWEQEGCPHGLDLDHWLRAEAELSSAPAKPGASRVREKKKASLGAEKPATPRRRTSAPRQTKR